MVVRIRRKKYATRMAKRTISGQTLKAVGIRLRMLRDVLGHPQAAWARALHVKPQILNKWEQGTRQPNIETLIVICASTGCTLDFIFRGVIGSDMRQELRESLTASFPNSAYVSVLFSPATDRPLPPSSSTRKRRS